MELKKFEAPTLAEALKVVKQELGPEAIIISTKNIRSAFGLMNRSSVEVTAAVSSEALEKKRFVETKLSAPQRHALQQQPSQKVMQTYDVLTGKRLNKGLQQQQQSNAFNAAAALLERGSSPATKSSVTNHKTSITQKRYIDIEDDESPAEQLGAYLGDRNQITQSVQQKATESKGLLPKLLAMLIESGITEEQVKSVGDELRSLMLREQVKDEMVLRMHLARLLMGRLRVAKPLSERLLNPANPRLITFVGPTGVGKTTTLAKIAAELVLQSQRKVTLATTDTFKIAAVEQLQTYANILRLHLEVCPNLESLQRLSENLAADEVVLIDTAGYGPRDKKKLEELRQTLEGNKMEIHLCMAANTSNRDAKEIVQRFDIFRPNYTVITKIDETLGFGNIYNIGLQAQMPLSYLTMGQRVPEDIEVASKERVADLIVNVSGGGNWFGSSR
jgi:flagellar biosynthesis protein FlhF